MLLLRIWQIIKYFITHRLDENVEEFLQKTTTEFRNVLDGFNDHYVSHCELYSLIDRWNSAYKKLMATWIPKSHKHYIDAQAFLTTYPVLKETVVESNKRFISEEKTRYDALLSDVDGKSLDDQQRTVVVTGEDSNLVIAGAGSGKTLTITGKVKYLCTAKKVKPEDILLIAFTHKSAAEMNERINNKLGISVDTMTFHKLGLEIISSARGERPDIDEENGLSSFVGRYLGKTIRDKPEEIKLLIQYFAYYLKIPADLERFDSLGDAYDYERGADYETLHSKCQQSEFVAETANARRSDRQTLRKEQVKSLDEVEIANYLFLNGINYEYEIQYPYPVNDKEHKVYRPDFYLPDYDIYIEHFGIAHDGSLPWLSPIEEQKYKDSMEWKRSVHKQYNTCLLETYSYYSSEGHLLTELETLLKNRGVEFKEPDFSAIFEAIYQDANEKYFSEFVSLCSTFITLFKSRGSSLDELDQMQLSKCVPQTSFYKERTRLFLNIIKPIIKAYNMHLEEDDKIDFSDMINKATELVVDGYQVHAYKWVIIDEYQDISVARFKLVKAIIDQTGAKLLCVGDDWQSIYRFTGSDIALFTRFGDFFADPFIYVLERTYRNSQQLIDVASSFIMKNKNQHKKSLKSPKSDEYPVHFVCYLDDPLFSFLYALDKIIEEAGSEASILILGRTKYDVEFLKKSNLFSFKKSGDVVYANSPETPIAFLTVHKAKGLEAENVILLNFKNATLGFPNKIADDPLLSLVLTDSDEYVYAEERRLLYVALTRTKGKIYVLLDDIVPSEFFQEFTESKNVSITHVDPEYQMEQVLCPRCKTGHLVIRKNEKEYRDFLGCSNYPHCNFTVNDTSILRENRRCPACGGFLIKRQGYTRFYGCNNYPRCRYTQDRI